MEKTKNVQGILSISDLHQGIFRSFSMGNDRFKPGNFIYGGNGSGKTTLSRIFKSLSATNEAQALYRPKVITSDPQNNIPWSIEVFNTAYVQANVSHLEEDLHPILLLGDESITLNEDKEGIEASISQKVEDLAQCEQNEKRAKKGLDDLLSTIAVELNNAGLSKFQRKQHDRTSVRKVFLELQVKDSKIPSGAEIEQARKIISNTAPDEIAEITVLDAETTFDEKELHCLENDVAQHCATKVEIYAIKRLLENKDISKWVEDGILIHRKQARINHEQAHINCEYCNQRVPEERQAALEKHFSDSDEELKRLLLSSKQRISDLLAALDELERRLPAVALTIHTTLRESYVEAQQSIRTEKTKEALELLKGLVEDKIDDRSRKIDVELTSDFGTTDIRDRLKGVNLLIRKNNLLKENYYDECGKAAAKITRDYISQRQNSLLPYLETEERSKKESNSLRSEVAQLKSNLRDVMEKMNEGAEGAKELSKTINDFLLHKELKVEYSIAENKFRLLRHGEIATSLSSGESSAIAFAYFATQLCEKDDLEMKETILVIDDPISNMDMQTRYQVFAHMRKYRKSVLQMFILSHDVELLALFTGDGGAKKMQFWSLDCSTEGEKRRTTLGKMSIELQEYGEYAFLLQKLRNFKNDPNLLFQYTLPNMVRRVLETFFHNCLPGAGEKGEMDLKDKLREIDIDDADIQVLLKHINQQSHVTTAVPDPGLRTSNQRCVETLLRIMEKAHKNHFDYLPKPETDGDSELIDVA